MSAPFRAKRHVSQSREHLDFILTIDFLRRGGREKEGKGRNTEGEDRNKRTRPGQWTQGRKGEKESHWHHVKKVPV